MPPLSFLDRFRQRRSSAVAPGFDGLAQVRAYWELRRDEGLPRRASLDPRGLNGVLDRVFLAERIGRGLLQLRAAGACLTDFAGLDVRGLPLSCLFAPESRAQLGQTIERVFDLPAVAELDLGSDRARRDAVLARLILLPLAEDHGAKVVLGAVSFAAPKSSRYKFQLRNWREERIDLPTTVAVKAAPQPIRRYGHLSLVHIRE